MNKAYYQALVSKLRAVQGFGANSWIKLYNGQLDTLEEQQIFRLPAILIEFANDIPIVALAGGYRQYNPVTLRLHILFDRRQVEDLTLLDVKDRVRSYLEGWIPTSIPGASSLMSQAERMDYSHTNLIDYQVDFLVRIPALGQVDLTVEATINEFPITSDIE